MLPGSFLTHKCERLEIVLFVIFASRGQKREIEVEGQKIQKNKFLIFLEKNNQTVFTGMHRKK